MLSYLSQPMPAPVFFRGLFNRLVIFSPMVIIPVNSPFSSNILCAVHSRFSWSPLANFTRLSKPYNNLLIVSSSKSFFIGFVIESLQPAAIAFSLLPSIPYAVCAIIIMFLLNFRICRVAS